MKTAQFGFLLLLLSAGCAIAEWTSHAPREEISPEFSKSGERLILKSANNPGTNGHWSHTFTVEGGKPYQFSVLRKATAIEHPRRSCVVKIEWLGPNDQPVTSPEPVNPKYFGSKETRARPEYPKDNGEADSQGWVKVAGSYTAPDKAISAKVQLHLRWTTNGKVTWKEIRFKKIEALPKREVTLAAVHHNLAGKRKTTLENLQVFEPLIAKAAAKGADLIVLPELLTCKGVTNDYVAAAEPIPGPTSDFFSKLSKQHKCYIVAGISERDDKQVYNVGVLLGPEGSIIGKYRKVTLPREEIEKGITPGDQYPVFNTRFGKVGIMICYDVFFPEVARELAANGAEVIALPIWGGNPRLAAARCAENGIYIVSSTYTNHHSNWMKTAIWNREGDRISEATEWGTVVTTTVDLNQRTYWAGLGDFQSRIAREAPVRKAEQPTD